MLLSFQIALRFYRGRQWGAMVSVISIISTIGIALGVAILIIALSAMNGFEHELKQRILAVVLHGEIEPVNPPFADWQKILKRIEQVPGIVAAAPYINFTGLIEREDKLQAIHLKGVDPVQEMRLSTLPRFVQENAWRNFVEGKQQIIIGKGVADKLKVKSGDWLTIMIPHNDPQNKLLDTKRIRLQVIGILLLHSQLDYSFALIPLADAQHYLNKGQDVEGIGIKVNDIFHANQLVHNAGQMSNTYVYIRSWINSYGYMYRDIQMIRAIIYLVMVQIIGIACFNIVSTLTMALKDKSANIAILGTLGAKDRLTRAIFMWYGLLVGLSGSIIGVITGVLIALNLTTLAKKFEYLFGRQLFSSDIYFIDFLPTKLKGWDVIIVLIITLLLSLLASYYPARRASNIAPARVLNAQ